MNFELPISTSILRLVSRLDQFRGVWASSGGLPPERLARLAETATHRSTGAACRLAGIRVTDEDVVSILRGGESTVLESGEIRGYAAALSRRFPEGALVTADEIRLLHGAMLVPPGQPFAPSEWRDQPNHLEAFDGQGRAIGRVFQTLPPRLIAETMDDLATWLELELKGRDAHPVQAIGAFILAVFHASPFSRGNVRICCLLSSHLLRRAGYEFMPYGSLEREFEDRLVEFYDAFDASSTKLWTGEADLTPWMEFFLSSAVRHAEQVQAKLDLERRAQEFSPLQRAIVDAVREHGTAGAALLLSATGTNRNTLKDNLRRLVDRGILEQMGKRRGTIYRLAAADLPSEPPQSDPAGS